MKGQRTLIGLLVVAAAAALGWWAVTQTSDETAAPRTTAGLPVIAVADLPPEGRETLELIDAGGPFPYDRDGAVFQNREGLLPGRPRGYYREYTVETPGSADRGARRIVAGEKGERYYTVDHYDSFRRISRERAS